MKQTDRILLRAPTDLSNFLGCRHLSALEGSPTLRRFDDLFFPGDAKEAVAFALLGYLALHGQPGNVPAATGASGPRVLGSLTPD